MEEEQAALALCPQRRWQESVREQKLLEPQDAKRTGRARKRCVPAAGDTAVGPKGLVFPLAVLQNHFLWVTSVTFGLPLRRVLPRGLCPQVLPGWMWPEGQILGPLGVEPHTPLSSAPLCQLQPCASAEATSC